MLMTGSDCRASLRAYKPRVFIDGEQVTSVADEPRLAPCIAAKYEQCTAVAICDDVFVTWDNKTQANS